MPSLDLPTWNSLPPTAQEQLARSLPLPLPFHYLGLQTFSFGDPSYTLAVFEYSGASFHLIPGAEGTLGYDPNRPFQPSPAQTASWQQTAADFQLGLSLQEYIISISTPCAPPASRPS